MTAPTNVTFTTGTTITSEWLNGVNDYVNDQTASQIPYTPPFTGSVVTTVQDKLSEYVSVKDFGAVGDGVTDDTAAIQAALNASNYVTFPEGSYLMNSGVTKINDDVKIDFGNATIINGGATYLFSFGQYGDTYSNENLQVTGGIFKQSDPTTSNNRNYIRVGGIRNFVIQDCVMYNVSNGGITVLVGSREGFIDNITIQGNTNYSTIRGIWLEGDQATGFSTQYVDISSITRNATPVPTANIFNVKISNCSIFFEGYGIYLMNATNCHIDNNYIDIGNSGARCIAVNNYSPGTLITNNTLRSGTTATGILVTQVSDGVVIDSNEFKGTFGGGYAIHVQYLAEASISNNRFVLASTTSVIQVDMGATVNVTNNYFSTSSYVNGSRCLWVTTIDPQSAGTGTYGNTATTLAGSVFQNNITYNYGIGVYETAQTAANGNIPGLNTVIVKDNVFNNLNSNTGADYAMVVSGSGPTYTLSYSYFNNTGLPADNANRNTVNASGTGLLPIRTDVQVCSFRVVVAASGGAITVTKNYGGYFGLSASRSSTDLLISPRTINSATGASVALPISIVDGAGTVYNYKIVKSSTNYVVTLYNSAGSAIDLTTTGVTIDIVVIGTAT